MPDISKINALAIGSVGKVDGLAKASILDIDGVTVPAGVAPPLDTYTGAAAAYSVRLLRTAYTGDIMRVRRASDNVEADVGFDGGELKLTSPISNTSDAQSYADFADFVDHTGTPTNAFVRYWYDQSGNANDAGQSTAPSQPQIYDATTGLITDNGKPAVQFNTSNSTYLKTATYAVELSQNNASVFSVHNSPVQSSEDGYIITEADNSSPYSSNFIYGNFDQPGGGIQTSVLWVNTTNFGTCVSGQCSSGFDYDGTNFQAYINGSASGSSGTATVNTEINSHTYIGSQATDSSTAFLNGKVQEIITYKTDQSSNRTGIQNNVNGFFSIY